MASRNPYENTPVKRDTSRDISYVTYYNDPARYKGWRADFNTGTMYDPKATQQAPTPPKQAANAMQVKTPTIPVPPPVEQQRVEFDNKLKQIQAEQVNYQASYANQLAALQNSYQQQLGLLTSAQPAQQQTQQDILAAYKQQYEQSRVESQGLLDSLSKRYESQLTERDNITKQLQSQYAQSLNDISSQKTSYEELLALQKQQSELQQAQADKALSEYEARNAMNTNYRTSSLLKTASAAQQRRAKYTNPYIAQTSNSQLSTLLR